MGFFSVAWRSVKFKIITVFVIFYTQIARRHICYYRIIGSLENIFYSLNRPIATLCKLVNNVINVDFLLALLGKLE